MHGPDDIKRFLEELEQTPFPSIACKRTGISKATIYRWRADDPKFKKDMDAAIETGRETITDSAEAHIVMAIKKGDYRAMRLWLENNTKRYYRPKKAISLPSRTIQAVKVQVVDQRGDEALNLIERLKYNKKLPNLSVEELLKQEQRDGIPPSPSP